MTGAGAAARGGDSSGEERDGAEVVEPKVTDCVALRICRRAAGWGTSGPAPPAGGRSLAVMPPETGPALLPSRASAAGPKSVRKWLATKAGCRCAERAVAWVARSSRKRSGLM